MGTPLKLSEYSAVLKARNAECVLCETPLDTNVINWYNHENGWNVAGKAYKQWLSITCQKCGYENSLMKLGIDRDIDVEKVTLTI